MKTLLIVKFRVQILMVLDTKFLKKGISHELTLVLQNYLYPSLRAICEVRANCIEKFYQLKNITLK
jgi:hypothetical protein